MPWKSATEALFRFRRNAGQYRAPFTVFKNCDIFFLKLEIHITVHHRPFTPGKPHVQALQETPQPRNPYARRPARAARRDAPRDSGAEAAHRRAADERAFARAYRACRAADDSARTADHRRDAGKARSRSTVRIRAITDRPGRRGDGRRAYDDAARRSAGVGPVDQAQRRARSLSRLWAGA